MVSDLFVMCLAVLGVLVGFVLPIMSPAESFLFSSGVVVCAGGYMIARLEERRSERRAQEKREAASEQRYLEGLAAAFSNQSATMKAVFERESANWRLAIHGRDALLARGVPATNSEVLELTDSARASVAKIAGVMVMSGTGMVTVSGQAPEVTVSESKASLFMPDVPSKDKLTS